MDAQKVIDSYINTVAARLPRRLRNDVGLELRTLLIEQLKATSAQEGREPDDKLAIEVVRKLGRPEEVAARYHRRGFELIEPGQAPTFVKLSAACVAIQWALTLPAVFASRTPIDEWWRMWGFSAFAWVGMLLVWFGLATSIRRRFPVEPDSLSRPWMHFLFWLPPADWHPVDREALERRAAINAFPLGVVSTIFFIAPAVFLDLFTPAGTDTSWALYDPDFQHWLLPPLITLMVLRLALFAVTVINESWRARLDPIRFALWVCFVALLYWVVSRWDIFATQLTDAVFKTWLLMFLLVNTIQIVVWVRRAFMRVRVPKTHLGLL